MVNVSDIYAMGGRPTAVVNALWSHGMDPAAEMLKGMAEASARYAVPIVGGHSNNRSARPQLAVSILGRATRLLTSFNARPGDALVMAVDLRGAYEEPFPYWNASTTAPAERLRGDLELLPAIAEAGLCDAGKDISMAGAIGTALMLLECSGVGATIDLDAVPRPADVPMQRWLGSFPSYGFVLSVRPSHVDAVLARFAGRGLAAAMVGEVDDTRELTLLQGAERELLWDLNRDPFICESMTQEVLGV
jgi:AIR synthase-related protein